MKLDCNKCHRKTEINIVEDMWNGCEKCYFVCEHCGEEYVISIMNESILDRIALLQVLEDGYKKLYDLNKDKGHLTLRMKVLLNRIKELRTENRREGKLLQALYDALK